MKTLTNFILICSFFLIPFFGETGGGLYAQPQTLFDHTWYFVNGELNGVVFTPPHSSLNGELKFMSDGIYISHPYCEEGVYGYFINFDNTDFTLDYLEAVIVGLCGQPYDTEFMNKHYNIYGQPNDFTQPPNNTFTYTLQAISNYHELTIENGNGDWAVYNSKLMSNPSFNQTGFSLYPNPVNETLHINNNFNQTVQTNIYDVNGKLLYTHTVENKNAAIDVKYLNQGLYFVVFENDTGERVSKRFVKK